MGEGHHLILGKTSDYVTGEIIPDTDDERYRQAIARFLVEMKGYSREDLRVRVRHDLRCSDICGYSITDIAIIIAGRTAMIVKYGPGSLVTRERPALATARTLEDSYTVPVAVVTNGQDAEVLDVSTGKVMATGLDAIPDRDELERISSTQVLDPVPPRQMDAEKRILLAFDGIEHSCECTEDRCNGVKPGGVRNAKGSSPSPRSPSSS